MLGRLTAILVGAMVLGGNAQAAEPKLTWRIKNSFAILANDTTQARFADDLKTYLACMAQEHNPLACPTSSSAGLTQKPYAIRFSAKDLATAPTLLAPSHPETIKDRVTLSARIEGLADGATCQWSLDDTLLIDGPCATEQLRVRLFDDESADGWRQAYKVSVAVKSGGREVVVQEDIRVRRVVVVALGDSFMSGEGNPHVRAVAGEGGRVEGWLEKRCHRSLLSASALAAWRMAQAGKAYVVYINAACSGAETWHVPKTARAYEGVENATLARNEDASRHFTRAYLPAQIDEVRKILCADRTPCAVRPDHLFLSIGINDLQFSDVVRRLILNTSGTPPATMTKAVAARLERLTKGAETPGTLGHVYKSVDAAFAPRNAYVVEYPDPTKADGGRFCDASPLITSTNLGKIDAAENQWAADNILKPLNAAIGTAVEAMRSTSSAWRMATGMVGATASHGYCAEKSFFNAGIDASYGSGTLHPNAAGHAAMAQVLLDLMTVPLP